MPRIEDLILQSVAYLYLSVEEAKKGVSYGGAGLLIRIESDPHSWEGYRYVVTNKHVIENGATVVRINTRDGKTDAIPLARNQWILHPTDDLAAAQISGIKLPFHQVRFIPEEYFLTKFATEALKLGIGDDVYMVGRFISHDGKQRNQPFVQSGIISLMPTNVETEWDEAGSPTKTEEFFLVEMRSLSGCSGSPVFFELPLLLPSNRITIENRELIERRWLLGIDCGHFKTHEKVFEVKKIRGEKQYNETNYEAVSNAGQMMVVPSWKLRELLDHPKFVMNREEENKKKRSVGEHSNQS